LRPTPTLPLQPWPLNGGNQFKDCNPTTSLQHFVLGFVLIFFHVPSCFVQDVIVITQIQDVMALNSKYHSPKFKMSWSQVQDVIWPKSTGVDQPIKWPNLLHKNKSPNSKGTGGFVRRQLSKDTPFPKKGYKFDLFLGI
jgi:hypothetical protein